MRPTAKQIREALCYNPLTGVFVWKIARGMQKAGAIAGFLDLHRGYFIIRFKRRNHGAHRLAWVIMKGRWPKQIDHKDGDPTNNRWENLRLASSSQNHANQKLHVDALCQMKGVTKRARYNKWRARIVVRGREIDLGYFDSSELAHTAYVVAAKKYFGEFARAR